MKKIFLFLVAYMAYLPFAFSATRTTDKELQKGIVEGLAVSKTEGEAGGLVGLSQWLKSELYTITFIIAIGAIVYIGIKMVMALGKPDEFKKAWKHFVYLVIGLFLVYASLGIVMLVSSLGKSF